MGLPPRGVRPASDTGRDEVGRATKGEGRKKGGGLEDRGEVFVGTLRGRRPQGRARVGDYCDYKKSRESPLSVRVNRGRN